MKYSNTNIIGDAGEHLLAARIIKLFGYPCRLNSIDIGIDAEIELIDRNFKSTGGFIKCQIKTTTDSSKMALYLEEKHLSYWNSMSIPVVIFLVHLHTEQIFWHCVDKIDTYEKSDSGYKIHFDSTQGLKSENKDRFDEIAIFPLIQRIKKIYETAYQTAVSDKAEFLDTRNYDLTTFEFLAENYYNIKSNLNDAERLIFQNPVLSKIKIDFSEHLEVIRDYLKEVAEGIETIESDHGDDFFAHLKN